MDEIILIGGGGHCRSVIDVIESEGRFKIAGIVDLPEKLGMKVLDYEIKWTDKDLKNLSNYYKYAIVTVGHVKLPHKRVELYEYIIKCGFELPTIISPFAHVSKYSYIGKGTVVMHNAIVGPNVKIGCNCIINTGAIVEHDSVIGNHTHISTGVVINGNVKIGDLCFIGSGSICVQGAKVDDNSFVKACSLIK